jgi:hypothetical protein
VGDRRWSYLLEADAAPALGTETIPWVAEVGSWVGVGQAASLAALIQSP